jgi:uncharacterized protein DUF4274
MSLAEQLTQLRPLMTPSEIEALLGPEQKKQALDLFSGFKRTTGVQIFFSHQDEVIDWITYSASFNFPRDVAVCGVCVGMTVEAMQKALPELRLADGETGEPNALGFVHYRAAPVSLNATLHVSVRNGEVADITLRRTDLNEVLDRRERQKAERRAEQDRERKRADRWKSIRDPDEMLLDWAENNSDRGASPDSPNVIFARWLIAKSDPDAWHILAMAWNWDYGRAPLVWIIRQNNCDIATALEVFFLADPSFYFRYGNDRSSVPAGWKTEDFDFLAEIRERIARGFYQRSEIVFDGEQHMLTISRGLVTADDRALARSFFPAVAGRKIPGRDLTESNDRNASECYEMLAAVN